MVFGIRAICGLPIAALFAEPLSAGGLFVFRSAISVAAAGLIS